MKTKMRPYCESYGFKQMRACVRLLLLETNLLHLHRSKLKSVVSKACLCRKPCLINCIDFNTQFPGFESHRKIFGRHLHVIGFKQQNEPHLTSHESLKFSSQTNVAHNNQINRLCLTSQNCIHQSGRELIMHVLHTHTHTFILT